MARFAFILLISFVAWNVAYADKRVALVIGNSDYPESPLINPKNDATDTADALKRLGFDVTPHLNLKLRQFDTALDVFEEKAKDADVALFYFAGHGLRIGDRGFLMPTDFKAETESSAFRELIAIQEIVSRIEKAAKVSIIILDACRDSPLAERFRRLALVRNRTAVPPKGLPSVSVVGSNTLVVYATVPGEVAKDNDGSKRNSPFTGALLNHIETPGLEIQSVFTRVTRDVLQATGGTQQPERLSRLQTELVFLQNSPVMPLGAGRSGASSSAIGSGLGSFSRSFATADLQSKLVNGLNLNLTQIKAKNSAVGYIDSSKTADKFSAAMRKTVLDFRTVTLEAGTESYFEKLKACKPKESEFLKSYFSLSLFYLMLNSNFDNGEYKDFTRGIYEKSYYLQNSHARNLILSRYETQDYQKIITEILGTFAQEENLRIHAKVLAKALIDYETKKTLPLTPSCFPDFSYAYIAKSELFENGSINFTMSPIAYLESFWARRKNEGTSNFTRLALGLIIADQTPRLQ